MREFLAVRRRQAHLQQQFGDALAQCRLARDEPVRAQWLRNDPSDPPARVEARIGVLENHLQAPAQCGGSLTAVQPGQFLTGKEDASAGRAVEPDHEPRDGRLAASRFADESEGFASTDREVDAVDGFQCRPLFVLQQALERRRGHVEVAP